MKELVGITDAFYQDHLRIPYEELVQMTGLPESVVEEAVGNTASYYRNGQTYQEACKNIAHFLVKALRAGQRPAGVLYFYEQVEVCQSAT